jgi:hypothetical protein
MDSGSIETKARHRNDRARKSLSQFKQAIPIFSAIFANFWLGLVCFVRKV